MGGKNKANRTKNNARPSSSGRSADLLGASIPQFVGFTGIKEASLSFPIVNDELESSLDSKFQLVLKKISKKDSITKLKGLQEFAEIIKSTETEEIKAVLPLWPRFYVVLVIDPDNRVREATHIVHNQIVLKAKKNLAPYLKQIMPAWFTSQYDTYPPAASAATQAFKDAFSPHKFQEAIIFCQQEIISYINENLINQSASTLTGKHCTPEDAEAKYERILIACLHGYYLYLEKLPVDNVKSINVNEEIVSNSKFWKLSKYKVVPVRSAWFKVVSIICQKALFLLKGKETQLLTTIVNNLDESEPTVLPYIWECCLLAVSSVEEWWKFLSIEKLFIPKLWKVLKQGGQGNAATIYPNLLPLLSHLPISLDESSPQFYDTFFENLRAGLKQKSVIASKSESAAVSSSLIECLQYVILQKQTDTHLCKSLIKNHLFSTIEFYLVEDQSGYKTIFTQIAPLIQSWSRCKEDDILGTYSAFFFENLIDTYDLILNNYEQNRNCDIGSICTKQVELLQLLKHKHRPKKQIKVQFATDEDLHPGIHGKPTIIETDKKYHEELNKVVYKVCEKYVGYIEENKTKELITSVYSLITDFDTRSFFVDLSVYLKEKNKANDILDIFNIFYNWLNSATLCCKDVVDLIFLLFIYADEDKKPQILESLSKIENENCLYWCISKALSHPHNKDVVMRNWLKTEKVDKFFLSVLEKEIADECPAELGVLLKLGLTDNEDGELCISKQAVSKIINKLTDTISNQDDFALTIDSCSSLAAYISAVVYTENLKLFYGENLLLCLFKFSCQNPSETETISSDTLWEVRTAWQDAVSILAGSLEKEDFKNLTKPFAEVVKEQFLINIFNKPFLDHLKDMIVYFLRAAHKNMPLNVTELVEIFFENELMARREQVTNLCILAEYVKGNLSSPYKEIETCDGKTIREVLILEFFLWIYLKLNVLTSQIEEDIEDDEDEDKLNECDNNEDKPILLNVVDSVDEFMAQNLYDSSLGDLYVTNFSNATYYTDNTLLEHKLNLTIKNLDSSIIKSISNLLGIKAGNNAWIWCKTVYDFHSKYSIDSNSNLAKVYEKLTRDITNDSLSLLHLTQVFSKHLSFDEVFKVQNFKVIVLRHLMHCEEIDVQIAEAFAEIEKFRIENVPLFLYSNPGGTDWKKVQNIIEIVRLFTGFMSEKFEVLTRKHWDFAVLSLASWAGNCLNSRQLYTKTHFQAMVSAVTDLYLATCKKIKSLQMENSNSNYIGEWNDVLVETIHGDLVQMWLFFAEQLSSEQPDNILAFKPFMQEFGKLTEFVHHNFIFKFGENMPKWSKYLRKSCALLTNSVSTLQLWGYNMLIVLVPALINIDEEAVNTNTPHRKGLIFEQFKEKVLEVQEIVTSMLMEVKLGESTCKVEPSTDSFTYTFAYLLFWDVLLTLSEQSSAEVRYQYADWLRGEEILKIFLGNLFRLLPEDVLHYSEGKSRSISDFFLKRPQTSYSVACTSEHIERYACWLYSLALAQLPAIVRQWWTGLDTKVAQVVDKVTSVYVSPLLISQEMNEIFQHQTKFKNMTIKVMPTVREVVAVYTVDEAQMELIITLPTNYPLGSPDVQCNRQIGGTTHKQWLLQFKKCVLHQNGRIWDGLSLWNNNLDKKFDGVEECYICFAVLHTGTYQLPKLSCQTCKKKFHSACLYKWFSTSNKSTCPICRNLF